MESYSRQRPITPPSDRKASQIRSDNNYDLNESYGKPANVISHSNKEKGNKLNNLPPVSTAPSIPSTTIASANPFLSFEERLHNPILSDTPVSGNHSIGNNRSRRVFNQRNETTHRIEKEVLSILKWRNPIRSGLILGLIVTSLLLTRWYSLLQISSSLLCIATGINLIYVNFLLQGRKIVTNEDISHPYTDVIENEERTMINRNTVNHYASMVTDVSETIIRALTRVVFIEDTKTSLKWMSIFFVVWKVSSIFSAMNIIMTGVISAFVFPRLYISNKDIVDSNIQKGQTLLNNGINKAQTAATEAVQTSYSKSRAFIAKVGSTDTDAKNVLTNTSATLKTE